MLQADTDQLRRRLTAYTGKSEIILFSNEPDCIAFFGDPETTGSQIDALDYYIGTSNVAKAVELFRKLPADLRGDLSPEEFEREQLLEKDLENHLEHHMELIEPELSLVGRQFSTKVGPIDLLGKAADGQLVVIELKKGRLADKVFGQICRYIGCIMSEEIAASRPVRGYIVGREVDQNLSYAVKVLPAGVVRLMTFTLQGSKGAEDWMTVG